MSWQADAQASANVSVAGTDRSALYYDSVTHLWRTKNQAGTDAPLNTVTSVTNADGTLTISPTTGAIVASLSSAYKSKIDNWMNKAVYNVLDNGISSSNSGATNVTAWNSLMTTLANSCATVYFPPAAVPYDFASVCNIPAGVHLRVVGGGPTSRTSDAFGVIIRTTSATADIFSCSEWIQEFVNLTFRTSVVRSAGAAVAAGNNVGIKVIDCEFNAMFNGIVFTGGAQAGNLCVVDLCHFTDSVNFSIQMDGANANAIIRGCTADCTVASVSHLEVNQCGSLLISDCDFIHAVNNMRLNPDSGTKGVFSLYATNTFFDTASGSSVKFQGGAAGTNIQRIKFVNCWFSGSVTGCEFAASSSTNAPTSIDFVNCDLFSNSANGVLATFVRDFSLSNCRVASNTTAGISTVAAAGAVTRFNIQNCVIGPCAGNAANGTGILIAAGTYLNYNITGNDVANNTTNNINDGGSVTGFNQKIVEDNIGHIVRGRLGVSVAATAGINTTETILAGGLNVAPLPANCLTAGTVIKFKTWGTCTPTVANATTFRLRIGTAGTTADGAVWTGVTPVSAVTGTAIPFEIEGSMTIRTTGAAATVHGTMRIHNQSLTSNATASTGIMVFSNQVVIPTFATFSTTVSNYISLTMVTGAATTTNTMQGAVLEVI